MKRSHILSLVLTSLVCTAGAFGQAATAKQTVTAFYKYDTMHSQAVTRRSVDARRPWLADSLYRLFRRELASQKEQQKTNPTDKPYFGDGFPFQPLSEPCEVRGRKYDWSHHVGRETVRGARASVRVSFDYPAVCSMRPTIYDIKLTKTGGKWRIYDVVYGGESSLVQGLTTYLEN